MVNRFLIPTVLICAFLPVLPAYAEAFPDVPEDHYAYSAIHALRDLGVVSGNPDGTFQPNASVNRAAALKMALALVTQDAEGNVHTGFADVPNDAWFAPYIASALQKNVIDGPDKRPKFEGERGVQKAEFIKMLLLANGADPNLFNVVSSALSDDVADSSAWFYPYIRYALASGMTSIGTMGTFDPGRALTRAETALLMHRFLRFRDATNTQELLQSTEKEMRLSRAYLDHNNPHQATLAATRALATAHGAYVSRPDASIVKGALKISEGFNLLIRGYKSGIDGDFEAAVSSASEAWKYAQAAMDIDSSLSEMAHALQQHAQTMAESGRTQLGQ